MEKSKKSVLRKNRILKIILSSVIAIAMASFYMIGSSAEYYKPYSFSDDEIELILSSSNPYYSIGSTSGGYVSYLKSSSSDVGSSTVEELPLTQQYNYSLYDLELYVDNPFVVLSDSYTILFDVNFSFDYTIKGGDTFTFYSRFGGSNYNIYFLDSDSTFQYCTYEVTSVSSSTGLPYSKSLFSSYKYYYNPDTDSVGTSNFPANVSQIDVTVPGSDYIDVTHLVITFSVSFEDLIGYMCPSINFVSLPGYYDLQNDSQNISEILDSLDSISGDPDSSIQNEIDQAQSEQEQALQDLQDNVDTINEPTMPPEAELPTAPLDPEEAEEVYEDINTVFNLDGLNLFNILVPTGCVGFLIFTVMRRF